MADDELSGKLQRRQCLIEETPEGDNPLQTNNNDEEKDTVAMADSELASKLNRRQNINEGAEESSPTTVFTNVYTEFKEFSRKQIKEYEVMFKRFDVNRDKFICFEELKHMMEKLGAPQTHLALKDMIKEVDEDEDNKINFREFLLIFRKAADGELVLDSGLCQLANLVEVEVHEVGVGGAKDFFEAKINQISNTNKFEQEIRQEQEEKKREIEEKKERKKAFKEKQSLFKPT
ncbi:PREDICTED: EF-hand domain-containing protein D2-like [Priapulus caudatus]|uniref:EF-hand domain-containing protein D2-like n=1 Tax=Priapulus caudatus TaxID=37621 RepID=A0ABM1E6R3_PRICU|nr:PREDICTED: EF-hand domain-containing protein D2-like [Priapulus caudatus]